VLSYLSFTRYIMRKLRVGHNRYLLKKDALGEIDRAAQVQVAYISVGT